MVNLNIFCLQLFKELKLATLVLLDTLKDNGIKTHPLYSLSYNFGGHRQPSFYKERKRNCGLALGHILGHYDINIFSNSRVFCGEI